MIVNSGRYEQAEEKLLTAMRENPAYGQAYLSLATLYSIQGRYDEAEHLQKRSQGLALHRDRAAYLEKQPAPSPDEQQQLGVSYAELGRHE